MVSASMEVKRLLSEEKNKFKAKEIAIFENPAKIKPILNKLSWEILNLLSKKEMYPLEIARQLKQHEQKIYYHIRKLEKVGVVKVVREENRKGAVAKFYKTIFPAMGVELPYGYQKISNFSALELNEKMKKFLQPLIKDRVLDGKIVVGSPDPHGPFKAKARDGHYAAYLTLFLGQFVALPEDFMIKLDVDVKVEKEESNNLLLVGGPGTNLITQELNEFLPIHFNMIPSAHGFILGGLVSEKTHKVYPADNMGIIAKISNPWNKKNNIIILAGNKAIGTKACVLAITKFSEKVLKNFNYDEKFAVVIQGFDLDGDGKVDSIEVLE
jgi:DNA-binding transcriptional ArsR family regulator